MKELLKMVIFDQKRLGWDIRYIQRSIPAGFINSADIVVISGIRRCGKSTLLQQIRAASDEKDYYINFDDERLVQFKLDDFQLLFETFIELFGVQKTFYFDEIQNVPGWERFVRRLHDYGNKVFVTGSNAALLSRELGTHLTGRYLSFELFPFSFGEFLLFKGKYPDTADFHTTEGKAGLKALFSEYFLTGGFPAYIRNKNDNYLKSLYESILYRDVMVRNNLTNEKELLELVYFLAGNISRMSSYNSLSKAIGVKNASTVSKYLHYVQNTYLLFQINKFDFSLRIQLQNPKKTYFIDHVLATRLGFLISEDKGRLLENIVYIELKRRGKEVFYFSAKNECDFLVRDQRQIITAIQICYSLDSRETREREIKGLKEAMQIHGLQIGFILTNDHEEIVNANGITINIIPVWKWLLQKDQ